MKVKHLIIITLILCTLGALSIVSRAGASTVNGFRPISSGQLVWVATLQRSETATVTLLQRGVNYYASLAFMNFDGEVSTTEIILPDNPSAVAVSGCGKTISFMAEIPAGDGYEIYLAQFEIPATIPCSGTSNYLPVITSFGASDG